MAGFTDEILSNAEQQRHEKWWHFSPETTVMGPWMLTTFCLVKFLTRHRRRVDFPTLGGPIIATNTGGGSAGTLSTTGIWCFFSLTSSVLYKWTIQDEHFYIINLYTMSVINMSILPLIYCVSLVTEEYLKTFNNYNMSLYGKGTISEHLLR